MTLKDIFKDVKTYMAILAVVAVVFGYIQLPNRVDAVEAKATNNKDNVQKLANTFDKYMAVQHERQIQEDSREELMLKLLAKE